GHLVYMQGLWWTRVSERREVLRRVSRIWRDMSSACRYMPVCRGPHEVVENTRGLHTFLCNFWVDFKLTAKHSPLCRPNPKRIFHRQPSPGETIVKGTLLWGEAAASREGPHQISAQWERLICHNDTGLGSSVVSSGQVLVRRQIEFALTQSLTKGGVGQDPSVTCSPISPNIYNPKPVMGIYNSKKDNGMVSLVVKKGSQRLGVPLILHASPPGHHSTEGSSTALQTPPQWISRLLLQAQP
ncbi:hypothetical protein GOODEAATRI_004112, partial [Goodea atripinnis]